MKEVAQFIFNNLILGSTKSFYIDFCGCNKGAPGNPLEFITFMLIITMIFCVGTYIADLVSSHGEIDCKYKRNYLIYYSILLMYEVITFSLFLLFLFQFHTVVAIILYAGYFTFRLIKSSGNESTVFGFCDSLWEYFNQLDRFMFKEKEYKQYYSALKKQTF